MATYKLSADERAALHSRASEWVDAMLRTSSSPSTRMPSIVECRVGPTHMACPLKGVITLGASKQVFDSLAENFGPDARLKDESLADGTEIRWVLHLPILVPNSSAAAAAAVHKKYRHSHRSGSEPTLEWPLMLLLVEVISIGALYYKYTVGTVW